jgi:mono/diheme cytochrome c family protein
MSTPRRLLAACLAASAAFATGCGDHKINVSKNEGSTVNRGAILFNDRCSGCHSLEAADAYGSKRPGQIKGGERTDGPNFNVRKETREDVLYAIRNGGFSGAIMPANIVVGPDAQKVAEFLAAYAGKGGESSSPTSGQSGSSSGSP